MPTSGWTPASVSKIVIAAAALDTWAPDHSFATEVRTAAPPAAGGVLEGDLVLRGSGDATLDETTLWGLAAQLRGAGLTRVRGRVLVERVPFGELGCDTVDRCTGLRRTSRAYNAAPSAIGVNYGAWCIRARAPVGATRAVVGGCATGEMPIPVTGSVGISTSSPGLRVERSTEATGDRISVGGSIAPGSEQTLHRSMSDPAAGTGLILRSILRQTGIAVDGNVETTVRASAEATRQLLASVDGLPLQEQVGRMMRWSNNYIADVLTMGVALQKRGSAPASLADAAGELTALIQAANGPGAAGAPVMESGSGLTTSNRLSARDLINVLRHEYRDTRHFPAFYGAFVVPQDASFAYLRTGSPGLAATRGIEDRLGHGTGFGECHRRLRAPQGWRLDGLCHHREWQRAPAADRARHGTARRTHGPRGIAVALLNARRHAAGVTRNSRECSPSSVST